MSQPHTMSQVFFYKAAEHPKLMQLIASAYSFVFGFGLVEAITGREILAGVLALLSACVAGYFASKPAVMRARIEEKQQHHTEQSSNEDERDRIHKKEIEFEQRQRKSDLDFEKARTNYFIKVERFSRASKHKAMSEINRLNFYAQELQRQLKVAGIPYKDVDFKYHEEICGEEDRAIALIELPECMTETTSPTRP